MVTGSAWQTVFTWQQNKIEGLAISYMLLPLTVLIFYFKKWNTVVNFEQDISSRKSYPI